MLPSGTTDPEAPPPQPTEASQPPHHWLQNLGLCVFAYTLGTLNPESKHMKRWLKVFIVSCMVAAFVDPYFFLLLSASEEYKCISMDLPMSFMLAAIRFLTDFIYFLHMMIRKGNHCLSEACKKAGIRGCGSHLDCSYKSVNVDGWLDNPDAAACLTPSGFSYGIYKRVVELATDEKRHKYLYSFSWGFYHVSTGGSLDPDPHYDEMLFTIVVTALVLVFTALLIGNMQSFLESFGQRRLAMLVENREVEKWMKFRQFPEELKRQVRTARMLSWSEQKIIESLPQQTQTNVERLLSQTITEEDPLQCCNKPHLDMERMIARIDEMAENMVNLKKDVSETVAMEIRNYLRATFSNPEMPSAPFGSPAKGFSVLEENIRVSEAANDGHEAANPALSASSGSPENPFQGPEGEREKRRSRRSRSYRSEVS